jgi:hypothetical protein
MGVFVSMWKSVNIAPIFANLYQNINLNHLVSLSKDLLHIIIEHVNN